MASNLSGGFKVNSKEALDIRMVLSKNEMITGKYDSTHAAFEGKTIAMPDHYICLCIDDNKLYTYDSSNPEGEFGKFIGNETIRDTDYNYKDSFIPGLGQTCYVDTASEGLKVKIGDGVTQWSQLDYFSASDIQAGLIKLYNSLGNNIDGTITQKKISEELLSRYKTSIDGENEILIFSL